MDLEACAETDSQRIAMKDGIVRCQLKPGRELDLDDAKAAVATIAKLAGSVRRPVLVDLRQLRAMKREARMYFAGPETAKVECAAALLVGSPLTRATGNFFLGLNKPLFPTRLFTSEEEAIAWLSTFRS
jgi:hypothetical protein